MTVKMVRYYDNDRRGMRVSGSRVSTRRPYRSRPRPTTAAERITEKYRANRGRTRNAQEERYERAQHSSPSNYRRQTPRQLDRRKRNDIRQIFAGQNIRDPCEAALILGSKDESLKEFLKCSTDNLNRVIRCLNIIDTAFKSKVTPGFLSKIIKVMKETEFIHKSVEKLKSFFKNEHSIKEGLHYLDAVCAITRIVIRVCSLSPSAITFIYGCQADISEVIDVIRRLIEDMQKESNTKTNYFSTETISESLKAENKIEKEGPELVACTDDYSNTMSDMFANGDIQNNSAEDTVLVNKIEGEGSALDGFIDNISSSLPLVDIPSCSDEESISKSTNEEKWPDLDRVLDGHNNQLLDTGSFHDAQSNSNQNYISENENLSDSIISSPRSTYSVSEKKDMIEKPSHFDKIKTNFQCMEVLFQELIDAVTSSATQTSKYSEHESRDNQRESEESFREIPICPRIGDLNGVIDPGLRINKAKGEYSNVDDYLDVHFRLLREDFIKPLREGIMEYKRKEINKEIRPLQDIKVYENTNIVSPFCGNGVNHILSFDINNLRHVRWNTSKRLKYGSLVCLTANNFEKCFFATIVDSDAKFRRQGRVHVKFINVPDQDQEELTQRKTFIMVESTAYFEAYRPVLSSLKNTDESDLPFQEYIIKCKNDVSPPKYLLRAPEPVMDLQCLFYEQYEFPKDASIPNEKPVNVNILENHWQIEDNISLDTSQMDALKSALTREFTLIQGPPGCGKTHVGLLITKVLLFNKHKWRHEDGSPLQILVVCYTNHALDQFMEGICSFQKDKIVRVGGRSSNETMEQFNLKNIKQNYRKLKQFPQSLRHGRSDALSEVIPIKQRINLLSEKIKLLRENIVSEKTLYSFMESKHRKQFEMFSRYNRFSQPPWLAFLGESCIVEWLGITAIAIRVQEYTYKERQRERIKDIEFEEMIDELLCDENREAMIEIDVDNSNRIEKNAKEELEDFKFGNLSIDIDQIGCSSLTHLDTKKRSRVTLERKMLIKHLKCKLQNIKPMSKTKARYVEDILSKDFSDDDRWALYLLWVQEKCDELQEAMEKDLDHYETADVRLKEVEIMENIHILRTADIIGMTITGAAVHKTVLKEIKPAIMIVEEAAEVLESHLVSNLTSGCEQLVMIGDHKQLKPKPNDFILERDYNMALSLFERMVRNGLRCDCLRMQHRMRPEIADNVRNFYKQLEDHGSVKHYDKIKGIANNIYFIDHEYLEEKKDEESKSHTNNHEAQFLIALCRYLLLQGYCASNITLLTTYSGQMFLMKKEMLKHGDLLRDVRITVVDNYQGEENDIILLSLVRSNKEKNIGYVKEDNRICVALSRAKKGLFIIGNRNCLQSSNSKWKTIIAIMSRNGFVGEALHLQCQNHPNDEGIMAKCSEDFNAAPEGGCGKMCEIRLECGHCCGKRCHIVNPEHIGFKCFKQCAKRCKNGHQCQKACFAECRCEELIIVTLKCGHITQIECSTNIESYVCQNSCNEKLNCGHLCRRKCKDECICMEPIEVKLNCGHVAIIPCSVDPTKHKCDARIEVLLPDCGHLETIFCRDRRNSVRCTNVCGLPLDCGHSCREKCGKINSTIPEDRYSKCLKGHESKCTGPCATILKCGHLCKGTCYNCFQGRWHKLCDNECDCTLICGHKCKGKCGFCLPCTEVCKRRCIHSYCERACFENCSPCTKRCGWKCKHYKCTVKCGQECNRQRCNKRCEKRLECNHSCIGMCGDPCPNLCRICDKEKMNEFVYPKNNKPNARFVQLQDCKHIIEYTFMDQYMNLNDGLCLKRCPKCDCEIWSTQGNRYENIVNKIFLRINDIRQVTLQDSELHKILMASASKHSAEVIDGNEISMRTQRPLASANFDLIAYFTKVNASSSQSQLYTYLACRDDINILNHLSILKFIKMVAIENSFILDDELLFEGASLCFLSQQHIYEVENEVKRFFDKCQLSSLRSIEYDSIEYKDTLDNAFNVLMRKGEYTEESRSKVQGCINQLPQRNQVDRKLIDLSFTVVDIDRDVVLRNRCVDIDFQKENQSHVCHTNIEDKNGILQKDAKIQSNAEKLQSIQSDYPLDNLEFKIVKQSIEHQDGIERNESNVEPEDEEILESDMPEIISRQIYFENDQGWQRSGMTTLKEVNYHLDDTEDGEIIEECETGVQGEHTKSRRNAFIVQKGTMGMFTEHENTFISGEETIQRNYIQNTKSRDTIKCHIDEECISDTLTAKYRDGWKYKVKLFTWRGTPYFHNTRSMFAIQQNKAVQAKGVNFKGKDITPNEIRIPSLSNKRKQTDDTLGDVEPTNKKIR